MTTPFGAVAISTQAPDTEAEGIAEVVYLGPGHRPCAPQDSLARRAMQQIECYLVDPRARFALPLAPRGTPFQRRVWTSIAAIPVGGTRCYGDLARALQSAPRAGGQASGANCFPLLIPCHRVVAASGLGGFAHHDAGIHLDIKRWLLAHEGVAF